MKRGGGKIFEAFQIDKSIEDMSELRDRKRGVSFDAFFEMFVVQVDREEFQG